VIIACILIRIYLQNSETFKYCKLFFIHINKYVVHCARSPMLLPVLVVRIADAQPPATNSVRKNHPLLYRNLYGSLLEAIQDVWFSKFGVQDRIAVLAGASLSCGDETGTHVEWVRRAMLTPLFLSSRHCLLQTV
jgi:hypothetical protein